MTRSTRARTAVAMAAAISILLAACSGSGPGTSPGSSGQPPGDGIAHPTGAGDLVFSIGYEGGFVPVEFIFAGLPAITIAGDGTVITQGAQIDIFPGPALPAVMSRRLSEAGLQLVLERVAQTGFFVESATFNEEAMAIDAQMTVFTMHADGREVTVKVGALGSVLDPNLAPPGLPERERQAHAALTPLAEQLTAIDQLIPASAWEETAWHPYQAEALRLLVTNTDDEPPDESGIARPEVAWPTDDDPAAFGEPFPVLDPARCGVVTGDAAIAWYEALAQANQLTRFTSGEHRYSVMVRPVLPGEEAACVMGQPVG